MKESGNTKKQDEKNRYTDNKIGNDNNETE